MNIVYFLVPAALVLGAAFVFAFIVMVRSGQYEDLETPALRMLFDESKVLNENINQPTTEKKNG